MAIQNIKILHPEKLCDESGEKIKIDLAPAGLYFSSPCFLPEFEAEDDPFEN
jgi:hypothetical protein